MDDTEILPMAEMLSDVLAEQLARQFPFNRPKEGMGIHYRAALDHIAEVTRVRLSKMALYNAVNGIQRPSDSTLYVLSHGLGIPMDRLLQAETPKKSANPDPTP